MATLKETYFWVEFEETGATITERSSDLMYSFNGIDWVDNGAPFMGNNKLIYFKAKDDSSVGGPFKFNKRAKIGGSLASLKSDEYGGAPSFQDNTFLTDASELIIPFDTLPDNFCYRMFKGCTSLVSAPSILPATTLDGWNNYGEMFMDCTSLVNGPSEISATILGQWCCIGMFAGCTSLVNAPALPATTLNVECYKNMFQSCTSLVNAPVLPATTLADYCYSGMFSACSSLVNAPALPITTLAQGCYASMFYGCTSLTTAPELPATTLAYGCYTGMFADCTNLVNAPELPATTLADWCYESMFYGCTNLNYIKMLATDISATFCLYHWVQDVAPTGTFVKAASNTDIPVDSVDGIPIGWSLYNEGDPNIPEPEEPTDPDNPNPPVDPDNPGGGGGEDPDNPNPPVDPNDPEKPDEPIVPVIVPEIRLYKTRLDYTSDGGEQRVQIDYYGATTINTPTCSQSWVTITKTQSGYYDEDGVRVDQHQYKITMAPTTFSRSTYVTFSCTDENGVVYSDSHLMLYQSEPSLPETPDTPVDPEEPLPPADPDVTPTVLLSKTQITLNNVGDSETIQVTYVGVDEIIPPEIGDGFTIEEIERVVTNDGIQVTYKITRISAKRQNAQINFVGKNNSNGQSGTSNKVSLRGEPVTATVELTTIWPKKGDYFLIEDKNDCHIDFTITNFNTPYTMTYSIKDTYGAVYLRKSEETIIDPDLYLSYDFKSLANNTNEPFIGTIEFTYTDELTNYTTSIPFYVGYANEGEVRVNVASYNFDKDGNRIDTQKDKIINAYYKKIATINDPVVDINWFHLGGPEISEYKEWVNGEYVVVGDTYKHNFTIDSNDGPSRKGTITFSGKGVDGKDYSYVLGINQEGTDTTKPIDEGFIELQQLSVALNSNGDAQTFQVKYYDAKTIYAPELEGDWATVTEVSRTSPVDDVAWNGEECQSIIITYKATAKTTTSGRQMRVKFSSDINYYDGGTIYMEKDKFIIYQLAEGSTEVQGLVSVLRGSTSFTYYGTPTGWNFRVAYKNVTPDTPTISQSWCRIAEVKDLSTTEYDYYKEYILEVDTNETMASRYCVITFIGNCEDGTQIKTPFQFTQQAMEENFNEGEYANYKGYFKDIEGTLHSVSFITNPRYDTYGDIRLAGDSPVVVSYSDSDTLYEPTRTSTCTVKVVSSHYLMNLYTGKAQGTQVIVKNEDRGTIEWCGYLQPNLYNQGFSSPVEEIEFEASDCISTLQYFRYEYYYNGNGQPMIVSFKNIIDSIADKCGLIQDYRFSQRMFSNSETSKIFDFKEFYISENNFYSEEGEPWTYKEVLEETCKYFGFVCFQWGESLYFIDYDTYKTTKDMVGYVYAKSDGWRTRSYRTISSPNQITVDSYRGTGGDISLDDIFNKVSVNCNYYNVEHIIPDLFEDDFLTERNATTITRLVNRGQEIGSQTTYNVYDHKNIKSHFYKPVVNTSYHEVEVEPTEDDFNSKTFFKNFVGGNIVDLYHLGYSDLKGRTYESKEWERFLLISQLNRPWCKGPIVGETDTSKYWEQYNFPIMEFVQLPQIFIDNHKEVYSSNTTTGGRVPSTRVSGIGSSSTTSRNDRPTVNPIKAEHFFVISAEAAFTPDFDEAFVPEVEEKGFGKWSNNDYGGYTYDRIMNTYQKEQNFAPKLTFYLEIPTEGWWNGEKWVDYETWFEVPLEELHYSDEVWYSFKNTQNTVQTNLFLGKAGYKIPLPESVESTAFMQFKIGMPKRFAHCNLGDDNGEAGNAYCLIKSLEMDIVTRNTSLLKDEDIIFENVIEESNVVDGPEIDLKITSDNNITYSYSTVSTKYGEDLINTTNFRFYDFDGELILPEERIIEKYVKQYSTPSLKENVTLDLSFTPAQMITDTYWDKQFVIVGQELDYKMCSQQITLLEKK